MSDSSGFFFDARQTSDDGNEAEDEDVAVFQKQATPDDIQEALDAAEYFINNRQSDLKQNTSFEEQKDGEAISEKRKSTLEKLHLGFIAKLMGRGTYASSGEEADEDDLKKTRSSPGLIATDQEMTDPATTTDGEQRMD